MVQPVRYWFSCIQWWILFPSHSTFNSKSPSPLWKSVFSWSFLISSAAYPTQAKPWSSTWSQQPKSPYSQLHHHSLFFTKDSVSSFKIKINYAINPWSKIPMLRKIKFHIPYQDLNIPVSLSVAYLVPSKQFILLVASHSRLPLP